MSGIYLHIPFCKQACSYCDFYFVTQSSYQQAFVDSLIKEINGYEDTSYAGEPVETIYFGGGTPSLLKAGEIEDILKQLSKVFNLDTREITFEMNPDNVTADYLSNLKLLGITRASMGVQSFQQELLTFMNRAHSREEAIRCLEILSKSQFSSYTVDLIYGNPGQTLSMLKEDLDTLLSFDPPHVSAYSLTIEPNTRLGKQVDLGRIIPSDDDTVADHFEYINKCFQEAGIQRYEVSNYSQPGKEAVHNSNYWKHENYLGFGPGAHSFWWAEKAVRWKNKASLRQYINSENYGSPREILSLEQLAEERLMMGLRTREGVSIRQLAKKYNYHLNDHQKDYLAGCKKNKTAKNKNNSLTLTDKGILVADAIILDLITQY